VSSPRGLSRAGLCWNCDRRTDVTVEITIRQSSGGQARVPLCEACCRTVYRPLVQELAWVREEGAAGTPRLIVERAPEARQRGTPTGEES
jgi:hypothetical protein